MPRWADNKQPKNEKENVHCLQVHTEKNKVGWRRWSSGVVAPAIVGDERRLLEGI